MQINIASAQSRRRRMALGLLAEASVQKQSDGRAIDKWKIYRAVCAAKPRLGLSDRALAVLSGLLSFYPETDLSDGKQLIVFPSNRQLALRAHGMAEATIRRHLSSLIEAGLIRRKDSPNGKRYARRSSDGDIQRAYGFSLAPLLARMHEFEAMARSLVEERERLSLLREAITIHRQEIEALLAHAGEIDFAWPEALSDRLILLQQMPTRSKDLAMLASVEQAVRSLKDELLNHLNSQRIFEKSSGKDRQIERHKESPKPDYNLESEDPAEKRCGTYRTSGIDHGLERVNQASMVQMDGTMPLGQILLACPEIRPYGPSADIRTLDDLCKAAFLVRQMLRITDTTFSSAINAMGMERAAITVACILERSMDISHPDAYLRDLIEKAKRKGFTPRAMLQALLRAKEPHKEDNIANNDLTEHKRRVGSVKPQNLVCAGLLEFY